MEPTDLVRALKAELVDNNLAIYRDLFRDTDRADATDPYWTRAFAMFDRLPPGDQIVLFELVRQVAVDTVSNMLGILDGSSTLPGVTEDFHLSVESDTLKRLNGELQDAFLELVEEE